jgi:hypothetical protein
MEETREPRADRHQSEPQGEAHGHHLSRRRFLRDLGLTSAGLLVGPRLLGSSARAGSRTSKIVRAFHAEATTGLDLNQAPIDYMVNSAIRELTGIETTAEAWKSLFPGIDASKSISIKINLACGDVPTHPEVVNAVIDGLLSMDLDGEHLPPEHIIVWDNDDAFFYYPAQNGYTHNYGGAGVQYYGTDHPSVGFDSSFTFPINHGSGHYTYHHPSRIITQRCDYLINAAVIKDHSDYGTWITMCLKNHYGSFDGIYSTYTHYAGHSRTQPELNRVLRDELGNKTRLWLIDATLGLYSGGPGYTPPGHTPPNWVYNSVILGLDPVATDRIGTIKMNEERAAHGLAARNPPTLPAAAGAPYYLGVSDPAQIDLVELDLGSQRVPEEERGPRALALLSPYPNPTRGASTLRFHTAVAREAELVIVDAGGSLVRRLRAGGFEAGMHRIGWDGRDDAGRPVASGAYFCRLLSGAVRREQRLVLVR